MIRKDIYLYIYTFNLVTYIHICIYINLMTNTQDFCKKMLNCKFIMSCRDNRYQILKTAIDKSIVNFQRKHSK